MTPQEEIEEFFVAADKEARSRGGKELGEVVQDLMRGLYKNDDPVSIAAVDSILPVIRRKHLSHHERVKQIYPILRRFLDDAFGKLQG
jgi:hypothetical protein